MSSDTQDYDSTMGTLSTPDDWARHIEALESRIAFQEHWLDTLGDTVATQERRLTRLERINDLMQEKLRDQQRALQEVDASAPGPADERPPHY